MSIPCVCVRVLSISYTTTLQCLSAQDSVSGRLHHTHDGVAADKGGFDGPRLGHIHFLSSEQLVKGEFTCKPSRAHVKKSI